ncbi:MULTISPECIES: twin-arginine translocase TatA/TatE family subunit [Brevibacterium]|nr:MULTISPECIES: twin-arginine translocase TatA/TatE family subunit [Brevibacterium]WAL40484.1 twin-arginine translocase TatA/TatE family subunit [Brevibacterium sp. BRM-1]
MFLNINGTEFLILVVVALVVIGPKRMPEYAQKLRDLVKMLRGKAEEAKRSVQEDFGDDFKDVDWRKLDPRQYDPRRIVREALAEDDGAPTASGSHASGAGSADAGSPSAGAQREEPITPVQRHARQAKLREADRPAPFDPEAT